MAGWEVLVRLVDGGRGCFWTFRDGQDSPRNEEPPGPKRSVVPRLRSSGLERWEKAVPLGSKAWNSQGDGGPSSRTSSHGRERSRRQRGCRRREEGSVILSLPSFLPASLSAGPPSGWTQLEACAYRCWEHCGGASRDAGQSQERAGVVLRAEGRRQAAIPVIPNINRWRRDKRSFQLV